MDVLLAGVWIVAAGGCGCELVAWGLPPPRRWGRAKVREAAVGEEYGRGDCTARVGAGLQCRTIRWWLELPARSANLGRTLSSRFGKEGPCAGGPAEPRVFLTVRRSGKLGRLVGGPGSKRKSLGQSSDRETAFFFLGDWKGGAPARTLRRARRAVRFSHPPRKEQGVAHVKDLPALSRTARAAARGPSVRRGPMGEIQPVTRVGRRGERLARACDFFRQGAGLEARTPTGRDGQACVPEPARYTAVGARMAGEVVAKLIGDAIR